ncbi:LysR family transcriptional regulator [Hespellia stercorisuis]|uniref:DNA-binding transcriptional regulator, LysR family n=1 Tax=Hespellia stercorisuis DSM 15480 TaxID=1121950 RepID=A0A1M6PAN9_9FIRM|nr:LysR family transcriptional regulator [Hespellia stercorisuis]SHK04930.1 DNA-binding transcriptional regulator, LysR family [Hespellia stercorisuis DSM 15480]
MDLLKAKIFLYAIDSGSLTKAATKFDYTPSGISHMMSAFEKDVGFPLLTRTKNGVLPTENAQKLIPIIRAECQWDERFMQTASEIRGMVSGNLNIAAYSSIATHWLPTVIREFHKDYPNISVNLLDGVWQEVENNLEEQKADIGFYSYQPMIRHHWIPLREDEMVVAVPKNHPLAQQEAVRISDIEKEPLIMPAFGSDIDVVNVLKEENIKVEYQFSTLQNYSALGMVEKEMGLLITNQLITKGRTNNLKLLPFDPPRYITLGIAVPLENRRIPAVVKFVEYAKRILME